MSVKSATTVLVYQELSCRQRRLLSNEEGGGKGVIIGLRIGSDLTDTWDDHFP